MGLNSKRNEEDFQFLDFSSEENQEELSHRKLVKKLLEEKLERKKLKEEIDELDGDFDWQDY